jgi:DNA processing protein
MEEFYWYWLCNIAGIGNVKIKRLIETFENPKNVYNASDDLLEKVGKLSAKDAFTLISSRKDNSYYREYNRLKERGIAFLSCNSSEYPQRLKNIYDYPCCIYYKGRLPSDTVPSVAIVGARNCTSYGKTIAKSFAAEFGRMGIQVISGMAAGIDSAGHYGCIEAGGYTCAVLGCGVDICYPRSNIELYTQIEDTGCILSEYAPGTPPVAGQFPMRNRIISGLSDVVILVEARNRSGSLITIDQALEQNKEVMVVPGRIGDALSEGCNNLLKIGAQIITCPNDILENSRIAALLKEKTMTNDANESTLNKKNINEQNTKNEKNNLASKKNMVYSVLNLYPKSLDCIVEETGLSIEILCPLLLEMLLDGQIEEIAKNSYVRIYM